ncbi:MAG: hypothetical protein K1X56_10525 [Flavobacteriales bacterium]|nr:hypothetical protein [Flavobacteriales bacterium]
MDRFTALNIFNISEEEFAEEGGSDRYEELLFELANYFLQNFPHPLLIDGRLKKLDTLEEAWKALGGREEAVLDSSLVLPEEIRDLSTLIQFYDEQLAQCRTRLANSQSAALLRKNLGELKVLQQWWDREFIRLTGELAVEPTVMPSKYPDTSAMRKSIKHSDFSFASENVDLLLPFKEEKNRILKQGHGR